MAARRACCRAEAFVSIERISGASETAKAVSLIATATRLSFSRVASAHREIRPRCRSRHTCDETEDALPGQVMNAATLLKPSGLESRSTPIPHPNRHKDGATASCIQICDQPRSPCERGGAARRQLQGRHQTTPAAPLYNAGGASTRH
eukprot:6204746-Pleurochrysis_carterae.AAC.1